MAADEPSGPRPGPVVLRIKLRYDDVEAMVQRFAGNVGKSGLFLPTKALQPVGAEVKFELKLANDTPVIMGLGKVRASRAPDPAHPRAAFGMAIELLRVTRESRDVILKLLERRKQLGLPDVAIPMPDDMDAARKPEADNAGSAPRAVTPAPSAPTRTPSAGVPMPAPSRDSGPLGGDSGLAFTSPRRPTGPIAIAKASTVAPLPPEPARKKRTPVHEVIERASGPVVLSAVPGLDADVDVAAALARARALAGGDLDAELDALRELAAAPIEISVEAASAELARQLGGAAVTRDRSARWAPPPATTAHEPQPVATAPEPSLVQESAPEPAPAQELSPEPPVIAPEAPPIQEMAAPVPEMSPDPITSYGERLRTEPEPEHEPDFEAEAEPVPSFSAARTEVDRESSPALPVEPEQIADEIHRLGDDDVEEVEHAGLTGHTPDPNAFDQHAFATEPSGPALERSFSEQLADLPDDDQPGALETPEPGPFADLAPELIADRGREPEPVLDPDPEPEPEPEQELDGAEELDADELEEIDDFEILAEADAADEDLMSAHGEADASSQYVAEAAPRTSDLDFASRLDLGDDSEAIPRQDSLAEIDPSPGELDPRMISAAHAIAAFDEDEHASDPAEEAPAVRGSFPPSIKKFDSSDLASGDRGDPGFDLETALEALDVDLDDLEIPHAKTMRPPTARERAQRVQHAAPIRAASEDGVLIDFDDDD